MFGSRVVVAVLVAAVVGPSASHCGGATAEQSAGGASAANRDAHTARRPEIGDRVVSEPFIALATKLHRARLAPLLTRGVRNGRVEGVEELVGRAAARVL